ncbi:polyprenol phosphomannose-dependent alpha 1,6 mannosyltransferase MptB [Propionibacterium australiense]|nr:polyprenol phosphomannose-dependent alpha 1,6 mannosyltransferase MptB [Propionibacterium australiense]RLP12019.1 hypothetical protein D7U36_03570 [Propionibacterium australiense]RLP12681.1 hypothetical protein D9T14_01755 [Propionibacterium australiense]
MSSAAPGAFATMRRLGADLLAAARVGIVRRGFYGTALIAIGALSPAYLPRSSPWWRMLASLRLEGSLSKITGTVVTMAGLLLVMSAWFALRPLRSSQAGSRSRGPQVYRHVKHWAVLAIWSVPFLLAPPIFSHDAYSYAAQGWLVHNGINPYYSGPGVLPGAFADQVSWVWRDTPSPYGPLSMQISHLLLHVFGFDPYWSAVAQRIPALVGVVLIGVCLPRIATRLHIDPAFTAWFGTLNPLLIIDFVGGCHNDALMMGLVVLGLWLATIPPANRTPQTRRRSWSDGGWWWLLGAVACGVGASIKQPALLAAYVVPMLARRWSGPGLREGLISVSRVLVSMLVAIGTFAGISLWTGLDFGWYNAVSVPGSSNSPAPSTIVGQLVRLGLRLAGGDPASRTAIDISHTVFLAIGVVLLAVTALTVARRRPATFVSWGYLIAAMASPALHSWYMLWGGLTLPLARPSSRQITVAIWVNFALLGYDAIDMSLRNNGLAISIAAVIAFLFMTWSHLSSVTVPGRVPETAAHLEIADVRGARTGTSGGAKAQDG